MLTRLCESVCVDVCVKEYLCSSYVIESALQLFLFPICCNLFKTRVLFVLWSENRLFHFIAY